MGYRNDAFYNLPQTERDIPRNNARFMYPSNQIRFLAAQEALNNMGGPTTNEPRASNQYIIKRGYMRGLGQPGIDSTFTTMKCGFQFNPQQIVQTVMMREDMYLPLLQDPTQFTQPMGSSVNFNFDLVFDRSHELAAGTTMESEGKYSAFNMDTPDYMKDAGDIGVLADMQLLYAIIGQGFSKELLDFQASRLEQSGFRQQNDGEGTAVTLDDIKKTVNDSNLGNAAFLIPNPVRVVFSSLFMVDGFVTGTSVDFLKFSNNMVPVQVKVGISMNAVYIGFAREKTFLTHQLEQAAITLKEEQATAVEESRELQAKISDKLKTFYYATSNYNDWLTAAGAPGGSTDVSPIPIYEFGFKGLNRPDDWVARLALGYYIPQVAGSTITPTQEMENFLNGGGENPVTVATTWYLYLYGPFNTNELARDFYVKRVSDSSKMIGKYSGSFEASSGSGTMQKIVEDSVLQNTAENAIPHVPGIDYDVYKNKWYVTQMDVRTNITGTTDTGGPVSALSKQWEVIEGDSKLRQRVAIPWSRGGIVRDG